MSAAEQSHGSTRRNAYQFSVTDETTGDQLQPTLAVELMSSHEYERLLAGETVSWNQIMREHPMLGTITVAQLVNLGVVRVTPDYDPGTGATDFRLCKLDPRSHDGRSRVNP